MFFDLRLNKQLSKQWWGWWFETPSCSLWRHCNGWCFVQIALIHFIRYYYILTVKRSSIIWKIQQLYIIRTGHLIWLCYRNRNIIWCYLWYNKGILLPNISDISHREIIQKRVTKIWMRGLFFYLPTTSPILIELYYTVTMARDTPISNFCLESNDYSSILWMMLSWSIGLAFSLNGGSVTDFFTVHLYPSNSVFIKTTAWVSMIIKCVLLNTMQRYYLLWTNDSVSSTQQ